MTKLPPIETLVALNPDNELLTALAARYGVNRGYLRSALTKAGAVVPDGRRCSKRVFVAKPGRKRKLPPLSELVTMFAADPKLTRLDIVERYAVALSTVSNALRDAGIKAALRRKFKKNQPHRVLPSDEQIRADIAADPALTAKQYAERHGAHMTTVHDAAIRAGVRFARPAARRLLPTIDELRTIVAAEPNLSQGDLCRRYGASSSRVSVVVRQAGITLKRSTPAPRVSTASAWSRSRTMNGDTCVALGIDPDHLRADYPERAAAHQLAVEAADKMTRAAWDEALRPIRENVDRGVWNSFMARAIAAGLLPAADTTALT